MNREKSKEPCASSLNSTLGLDIRLSISMKNLSYRP